MLSSRFRRLFGPSALLLTLALIAPTGGAVAEEPLPAPGDFVGVTERALIPGLPELPGLPGFGNDGSSVPPTYPTNPQGDPPGANDWSCKVTTKRPHPVVLVHGTFGDRRSLLEKLSRRTSRKGYCVYSLDYGNRGTGDIKKSARQLKRFTKKVVRRSGAETAALVGHSQGGMMPRWMIKFQGGKRFVDELIGIAPSNHGTESTGESNPASNTFLNTFCFACRQQSAGSPFLTKLNRGDETPGKISYTNITTRNDVVVTPHTSGYLKGKRLTTNITLQNKCPNNQSDHVLIPTNNTTIAIVMNALKREGKPARKGIKPTCSSDLF